METAHVYKKLALPITIHGFSTADRIKNESGESLDPKGRCEIMGKN